MVTFTNKQLTYQLVTGLADRGITTAQLLATGQPLSSGQIEFLQKQLADQLGEGLDPGATVLISTILGNPSAASYTGTPAGASTPVTITANKGGAQTIVLTFTGSNTIAAEITTYNTANPNNQVTLTSGVGTQTPTAGTISLTGGGARALSAKQQKLLQNALSDQSGQLTAALVAGTNFYVSLRVAAI